MPRISMTWAACVRRAVRFRIATDRRPSPRAPDEAQNGYANRPWWTSRIRRSSRARRGRRPRRPQGTEPRNRPQTLRRMIHAARNGRCADLLFPLAVLPRSRDAPAIRATASPARPARRRKRPGARCTREWTISPARFPMRLIVSDAIHSIQHRGPAAGEQGQSRFTFFIGNHDGDIILNDRDRSILRSYTCSIARCNRVDNSATTRREALLGKLWRRLCARAASPDLDASPDTDICFLSAVEMARLIRARSCPPARCWPLT